MADCVETECEENSNFLSSSEKLESTSTVGNLRSTELSAISKHTSITSMTHQGINNTSLFYSS